MNAEKILDLFSLEGQLAIVTGGAGRLGVQHCKILHDAGARVISFDVARNGELDGIAEQVVVDITSHNAVTRTVDTLVSVCGRIDILINNAAFNPRVGKDADATSDEHWSPYEIYPESTWRKEFAVGLDGTQWCTQAVAKYMIPQNRGCIINIASTSAITAPDHRKYKPGKFKSVAYPIIKAALVMHAKDWASYFSRVAPCIRINSVCFGAVNFGSMDPEFLAKLGERNMLGRPARPDEYQGVILFLCSKAAEFITASTLVADGGQTAW
ncbi:hypothetical protein A2833_02530 [Candidatus Azambacteria bacterium RIFCSPHIGHO2_01_FULL_44_55]|uniref:Oxidoreductase n=1 Tax=Candidatus Azambacteria bacterium RIFCSPLOWO2_02_FULL_44_14 TaxID=1797306 RepID=A0A1F5CD19_9BACT|nr:MAG: hypothetical protein A3A18_01205 [Candidatus Azambacteria bacterium RIFCSPLOWO2_01_FULL_44_84]OGD33324.1 MAG: hypothetical protein A3C78_02095 [Candidatus Azambacteria bacterium RIFCSPHIGHO2_02_FULL_45_18]OGD40649.1 MAG: hypothetical protein A2833_02530 [Candidatus Azambacteria bacterium RIFCSPHIGHO2_01_FULL_44_55]OGD40751.1 MAG: hypothetical protein A3I30_01610 [Candidatus Azambacteria bacterium RIFCSPLOWO2_02_FULL_44_14]OGD49767.1 MAG: hypothetical protein A2608_00540 [Candidatus Azam